MHEQSETTQRSDGRWINVYGRFTPKAGQQLSALFGEKSNWATMEEADAAAKRRSKYMRENLPKSGHIKGNWGDIGRARQEEAVLLGGFKSDQTKKSKKKL